MNLLGKTFHTHAQAHTETRHRTHKPGAFLFHWNFNRLNVERAQGFYFVFLPHFPSSLVACAAAKSAATQMSRREANEKCIEFKCVRFWIVDTGAVTTLYYVQCACKCALCYGLAADKHEMGRKMTHLNRWTNNESAHTHTRDDERNKKSGARKKDELQRIVHSRP